LKSKDLLSHISDLESALDNFSFGELTTSDASRLKKSFDRFKKDLENNLWGNETTVPKEDSSPSKSTKKHVRSASKDQELIAKVSHEIRTPLSGIVGFADLLKDSDLSEPQKDQVEAIRSASRSLIRIVNELLQYTKLEDGLDENNEGTFNIYNLIGEVNFLCDTLIVDKSITLQVIKDPSIPKILIGDPSKLSQILLNIIGNAIKFVEKGGITLTVRLKRKLQDQVLIEFETKDTGIGISKEDLTHIFDAFKQAKQHTFSKYGGTGLGLGIVKELVETLEGDLKVSSQLGVGSTFTVTLPFTESREKETKTEAEKPDASRDLQGMQILVFEDNPLNQFLIKQHLKLWKCQYFITENALEGFKILENENIDVVLMDLRMPVMDGYEVTRRIRANKATHINNVPIIALTADFGIQEQDKCKAEGINGFVLKPYTADELYGKIKDYAKWNKNSTDLKLNKSEEKKVTVSVEKTSKIDLTEVLEECMGEVDMLKELIRLFKGNALEFIGLAKLHLQNKDYEQLQFATHKIKAGLAMMETQNLLIIVQQLHENCKTDKNHEHMQYLYEQFVLEYPMVEVAIDNELERLLRNS
jgi:signal transduction histidine kinase/DNA-binding response OmpR family regulator